MLTKRDEFSFLVALGFDLLVTLGLPLLDSLRHPLVVALVFLFVTLDFLLAALGPSP